MRGEQCLGAVKLCSFKCLGNYLLGSDLKHSIVGSTINGDGDSNNVLRVGELDLTRGNDLLINLCRSDIRTLTLSGSSKVGATATLYVLKR